MTTPANDREFNHFDEARCELREGIENSRELVRQSRVLIELSESDGLYGAANDEGPIAN